MLGGGLSERLPRLGALLVLASVASLGLPGLAGFWGEAFALQAAFRPAPGLSRALYAVLLAVAAAGAALTAAYFLRLLRALVVGPDVPTGDRRVGGAADVAAGGAGRVGAAGRAHPGGGALPAAGARADRRPGPRAARGLRMSARAKAHDSASRPRGDRWAR